MKCLLHRDWLLGARGKADEKQLFFFLMTAQVSKFKPPNREILQRS